MKKVCLNLAIAVLIAACSSTNVSSDTPYAAGPDLQSAQAVSGAPARSPAIDQFRPNPTTQTSLDYTVWDDALKYIVLNMGFSLRQLAGKPEPTVGSRFIVGHDSPYRLEGNKIVYSLLDREIIDSISEYRISLEEVANQISIPSLPRNEQLAFWLNLHNVIVIDEIGKAYPVQYPNRMQLGDEDLPLHQAKLVTIDGIDLSLEDIRERIVYANWEDPVVIYGFFHGDIGSPAIPRETYDGDNLSRILNYNAREFVNSLRGVNRGRSTMYVSEIYREAAPYYFPNFEEDLKTHLTKYAGPEVKEILAMDFQVKFERYEARVADLSGGEIRSADLTVIDGNGTAGERRPWEPLKRSPQVDRVLREYAEKLQRIRESGGFKTTVTIIDLPDRAEGSDEIR